MVPGVCHGAGLGHLPGQGMQIGRGLRLCHHALKNPEVLGHVVPQHQDLLLLAEQALIAGKSHAFPLRQRPGLRLAGNFA